MTRQTKFQRQLEQDIIRARAKIKGLIKRGAKPQSIIDHYTLPSRSVSQMSVPERRRVARELQAFIGRGNQFHVTGSGGVVRQSTYRRYQALQRRVQKARTRYDAELYGDTGFTSAEIRAIQGETLYGRRVSVEPASEKGMRVRIAKLEQTLSPEYMEMRESQYRANVLKAIRGMSNRALLDEFEKLSTSEMIRLSHVSDFTTLVFGWDSEQSDDADEEAERIARIYSLISR